MAFKLFYSGAQSKRLGAAIINQTAWYKFDDWFGSTAVNFSGNSRDADILCLNASWIK